MAKRRQLGCRFGIGEWYGHSFINLTPKQRRDFAGLAIHQNKENSPFCPFKPGNEKCTKRGGICSLRLYKPVGNNEAIPLHGQEGDLRTTCPHRFKQSGIIYSTVGQKILGTNTPEIIGEVRFLQREVSGDLEASPKESQEQASGISDAPTEDVGNIDNVLIHKNNHELWCALEVQAVYFSGEKWGHLFKLIKEFPTDALPYPDRTRRPDYRSSGPKRLMPQLQIKVPTLRRWGKKMAVVVDAAWFRTNVIGVQTVSHLSNADIIWFVVSFDEKTDPATIKISKVEMQILERAVEGLTGGFPVTLPEFQEKIEEKLELERKKKEKLERKAKKLPRPPEIPANK